MRYQEASGQAESRTCSSARHFWKLSLMERCCSPTGRTEDVSTTCEFDGHRRCWEASPPPLLAPKLRLRRLLLLLAAARADGRRSTITTLQARLQPMQLRAKASTTEQDLAKLPHATYLQPRRQSVAG